jgi:hypothetical protein
VKSRKTYSRVKSKKKRNIAVAFFLGSVMVVLIFHFFGSQPQNQMVSSGPFQFKAAVVDQLSLTMPNQTFIETATSILKQAGFAVDYYPGANVTVEFFRKLATYGYGLIVLRVHTTEHGDFFTSQSYNQSSYVMEQLNDEVVKVSYSKSPPYYFGVSPSFVKSCMDGSLAHTIVIAMGCTSLMYQDMAKAFVEKGASVYTGWSSSVSADRTDDATALLLRLLLVEMETIQQATDNIMREVPLDPGPNISTLEYYPHAIGNQTIENISGKS